MAASAGKEIDPPLGVVEQDSVVPCWFVIGKVGGFPIDFLVDTGASSNVLGTDVYYSLGYEKGHPWKQTDIALRGANGAPLVVEGAVELEVEIEGVEYSVEVVIADIAGVSGILGMPFLMQKPMPFRTS